MSVGLLVRPSGVNIKELLVVPNLTEYSLTVIYAASPVPVPAFVATNSSPTVLLEAPIFVKSVVPNDTIL